MDSSDEQRFQFLITPLKPADKGKPKAHKDMKKTEIISKQTFSASAPRMLCPHTMVITQIWAAQSGT